jgi:5'-3' exonuclease
VRVVLAVDGNSLIHRSYHAAASSGVRDAAGEPIWAVRGLLVQLIAAVERIGPDVVVVGFDDPSTSWRRENWPLYKAKRGPKLESLVGQLRRAAQVLGDMGVTVVVPYGLEADDVLASTARQAAASGASTVIVTSDRDAFALIDDTTHVLRIINGGVECSPLITAERLVMLLGVRAEQYADFAALRGDPSDNLSGVRGFGPKTAARLLAAAGSAQAAFDNPDVVPAFAPRLREPGARAAWARNRQIMTMRTDVDVPMDGAWPLEMATVRAEFTALRLTWTTANALRVLCGSPQVEVERQLAWDSVPVTATSWVSRPPRLARRQAAAQLALF